MSPAVRQRAEVVREAAWVCARCGRRYTRLDHQPPSGNGQCASRPIPREALSPVNPALVAQLLRGPCDWVPVPPVRRMRAAVLPGTGTAADRYVCGEFVGLVERSLLSEETERMAVEDMCDHMQDMVVRSLRPMNGHIKTEADNG